MPNQNHRPTIGRFVCSGCGRNLPKTELARGNVSLCRDCLDDLNNNVNVEMYGDACTYPGIDWDEVGNH